MEAQCIVVGKSALAEVTAKHLNKSGILTRVLVYSPGDKGVYDTCDQERQLRVVCVFTGGMMNRYADFVRSLRLHLMPNVYLCLVREIQQRGEQLPAGLEKVVSKEISGTALEPLVVTDMIRAEWFGEHFSPRKAQPYSARRTPAVPLRPMLSVATPRVESPTPVHQPSQDVELELEEECDAGPQGFEATSAKAVHAPVGERRESLTVRQTVVKVRQLLAEGLGKETIANRFGKSVAWVQVMKDLGKLSDDILNMLPEYPPQGRAKLPHGKIAQTHARLLLQLPEGDRLNAAKHIVAEGLDQPAVEVYVQSLLASRTGTASKAWAFGKSPEVILRSLLDLSGDALNVLVEMPATELKTLLQEVGREHDVSDKLQSAAVKTAVLAKRLASH